MKTREEKQKGNVGYYARATVLRMEECDRIEAVRAEVLRARGLEAVVGAVAAAAVVVGTVAMAAATSAAAVAEEAVVVAAVAAVVAERRAEGLAGRG